MLTITYVWYAIIGNWRSRTCQQCEEETRQWWCRSACHLRRTPQAFAWLRWRSCTHLSLVAPPSCSCIAVPWSVAHPPERNTAEETFVINKLSMLLRHNVLNSSQSPIQISIFFIWLPKQFSLFSLVFFVTLEQHIFLVLWISALVEALGGQKWPLNAINWATRT